MTITLYRPSQIGGCITKIESSKGTTIFVDLGHNLPRGEEDAPDEYASAEAVEELTGRHGYLLYAYARRPYRLAEICAGWHRIVPWATCRQYYDG